MGGYHHRKIQRSDHDSIDISADAWCQLQIMLANSVLSGDVVEYACVNLLVESKSGEAVSFRAPPAVDGLKLPLTVGKVGAWEERCLQCCRTTENSSDYNRRGVLVLMIKRHGFHESLQLELERKIRGCRSVHRLVWTRSQSAAYAAHL